MYQKWDHVENPANPVRRSAQPRAVLRGLANKPLSAVRLKPRGTGQAEITGEVMVDLTPREGLGALHMISPQVFVTRAYRPAPPAASSESVTRR